MIRATSRQTASCVSIVSGHFAPLTVGHLDLIRGARECGDWLVAIVNNDCQVFLKGSVPFGSAMERAEIIAAIKYVDEVVISVDRDRTVNKTLEFILSHCDKAVLVHGGDVQDRSRVREADVCERYGAEIIFLPGEKRASSSELIRKAIEHYARRTETN